MLFNAQATNISNNLDRTNSRYRFSHQQQTFSRTAEGDYFPWERTDLVDALKATR